MRRHLKYLHILTTSICFFSLYGQAEKVKPNILLIIVDDLNSFATDHPQLHAPNIKKLVRQGLVFTNAYCTGPSCNPSRTSLLTGLHPNKTGIYDNKDRWPTTLLDSQLIPRYFKGNGYKTFCAGKINHKHLSDELNKKNWSEIQSGLQVNKNPPVQRPVSGIKMDKRKFDWGPIPHSSDKDYADSHYADWCSRKLSQSIDSPFIMFCGFYHPHVPMYTPSKYYEIYDKIDVQLPQYNENDLKDLPEEGIKIIKKRTEFTKIIEADRWQDSQKAYLASISFMDAQLGKVLDSLEKSPHKENTYIFFMGDNGMHQGQKNRFTKGTLWEPATSVPLIVCGPGVKTGICKKIVSLIDIYPTLIDIAGLPSKVLPGESILPLLKNPEAESRNSALMMTRPNRMAIRYKHWRLIKYENSEELYSQEKDKLEWNNLSNNPKFQSIKNELLEKLNILKNY